jgi:hypothetical protein
MIAKHVEHCTKKRSKSSAESPDEESRWSRASQVVAVIPSSS